jgi:hypothetical protein
VAKKATSVDIGNALKKFVMVIIKCIYRDVKHERIICDCHIIYVSLPRQFVMVIIKCIYRDVKDERIICDCHIIYVSLPEDSFVLRTHEN